MKKLSLLGLILSVVWTLFFLCLLYFKQSTLSELSLNEWGDFFSGFAAPLALVWLVLGYLQQGEEIRQNTEVLRAQQKELENQVRETAALAASSARQAEAAEEMTKITASENSRRMYESFFKGGK